MRDDTGTWDEAALRRLGTALAVSAARFTRLAARESGSGLPSATWRALAHLDEHGALRVGDLARLDRLSQPTATGLVQRLADTGLVVREADPDDARAVRVALTPAGRRALGEARDGVAAAFAPRLARLAATDLDLLARAVAVLDAVAAVDPQHDLEETFPG